MVAKPKANCAGKSGCKCAEKRKATGHAYRANLTRDGETRRITYEGREHLVVPVVMARADVVMNGSWVPVEELIPETWNGVPVTVGHPQEGQDFTSANSPEVLTDWSVGRIFNAVLDGLKLKAEAWIDVARADAVAPDLVARLEANAGMDVSTGYFCDDEPAEGQLGGKPYQKISRNLRPDHLALLPEEEGACSWGDGCGVRSNQGTIMSKVQEALKTITKALTGNGGAKPKKKVNERGNDDDRRQIAADLISMESSPFVPDDEDSLRMMSEDTLKTLRDQYVSGNADGEEPEPETAEEEEPETQEETEVPEGNEGESDGEEEAPKPQKKGKAMSAKSPARGLALNADDRAALDFARRTYGEHKAALVAKVVANSAITKEQAEAMPVATLEVVANGLQPVANYGGRALPEGEPADDAAKAMVAGSVVDFIRNKAEKGAKS